MRLEDMNHEFPKMPDEIRAMVEKEVAKQTKGTGTVRLTETAQRRRSRRLAKRMLVASVAAALMLGTTVFAGVLYQMHNERVGNYGVHTTIEGNTEQKIIEGNIEIPKVTMELGYLPEGMIEVEKQEYSYEDSPNRGGLSIFFYEIDTGESDFEMLTKDVTEMEECQIGGRDAVYMLLNNFTGDDKAFNQRIYVMYADVHYIMEMCVAADVSKEEAFKIAEGIRLLPAQEGTESEALVDCMSWSDYVQSQREFVYNTEESLTAVPKEEMKNTHKIGESFGLTGYVSNMPTEDEWKVCVQKVEVLDHVDVLDLSLMGEVFKESLQSETDADGKLLPAERQYVKYGDGVDSVTEVVNTESVEQKLVYVTVDYTNTGNEELTNVLFLGGLMKIQEYGDEMHLHSWKQPEDGSWDDITYAGNAGFREMWYYDVYGGEGGNNYISSIQPGETVTVHMAWLVPADELDLLYLNLDTISSCYEFSENALRTGYVDIRQ